MTSATPFLPGLSPVAGKSLTAERDAGNLTSNGGLIALREIERRLGIADMIAGPIPDIRDPALITHTYADMVRARMMMIAAGYEDCDDIDTLKTDPAFKIACDRAPETGVDLMSQPTLSRLENAADAMTLYKIGRGFIDAFCKGYATAPASIELDIDDTDDMAHGQQEFVLFNTHAGGHCFQPMKIFEAKSGMPLVALLRRPSPHVDPEPVTSTAAGGPARPLGLPPNVLFALLLVAGLGGSWGVYDATPQGDKSRKAVSTAGLVVDRVPAEEWNQIFNEAWRRYRDFFYVP